MIYLALLALFTGPAVCQYYENWNYYNQQQQQVFQQPQYDQRVYSQFQQPVQQPQPQIYSQTFTVPQQQQPQPVAQQQPSIQYQQQQFVPQQPQQQFVKQQQPYLEQPQQQYVPQQQQQQAPVQQYQQQQPQQYAPQQPQPQQYQPQQQAPVVQQYQQQAAPQQVYQDPTLLHNNNVRSIQNYQENRIFREQQVLQGQGQEKIQQLSQPPPAPRPQPTQIQYRAPEPPQKFVPSLRDLYSIEAARPRGPKVTYSPTDVVVEGHRSALENVERTAPLTKVRGGPQYHRSSSAAVPPQGAQVTAPPQPAPRQRTPDVQAVPNAVIASVPQVQLVEKSSRPEQHRPVQKTRPAAGGRSGVPEATVVVVPQKTRPATAAPVTTAAPVQSHLSTGKTASGKFLECCQNRRVEKSCERICNFDVLSKKTLTGMFLGTDPCPQSHGIDLMQCAANNDDHTQCCIEKEVDRTKAGSKCLGFCNMKPGVTFQADVSMLPCWSVLNDIKDCFKENLERLF